MTTSTDEARSEPDRRSAERLPLHRVLHNRRWVRRSEPFPHVVAQNVFEPDFYQQLHEQFLRVAREHPKAFEPNMGQYDAAGTDLGNYRNGPLGLFVSRQWHDLIADVMRVRATGDVSATLHHHAPGSRSGWPHNDLNPGWFGGPAPQPDEIRLQSASKVNYQSGNRPAGVDARETVRAVSMLFYLGNTDWTPGDGGETGLFTSYDSAVHGPAVAVPPINNSLVMFECTRFSLHAFISNRVQQRNCIVMWLHRSKDEAVQRWGDQSIVYW